jgi:hypothetical protein
MNWGIFSLLGVILPVLAGVAGFFVYLAKKSAAFQAAAVSSRVTAPANETRAERDLVEVHD